MAWDQKDRDELAGLMKSHREAVMQGVKEEIASAQKAVFEQLKKEQIERKGELILPDNETDQVSSRLLKRFGFDGSLISLQKAAMAPGICEYDFVSKRVHAKDSRLGLLAELKNAWNDAAFLKGYYRQGGRLMDGNLQPMRLQDTPVVKRLHELISMADTELGKAISSTASGSGSDWVPTEFTPELIRVFQLNLMVAGLFRQFPMKRRLQNLPTATSHVTVYVPGQNTAPTESSPGTSAVSLNAISVKGYTLVSFEEEVDSIVPIIPTITEMVLLGIARGIEDMIINGDDATPHFDSDVTAATDVRKQRDGLRLKASEKGTETAGGNVAVTTVANLNSTIREARKDMGIYGVRTWGGEVCVIIGPQTHNQMIQIPATDIWTREKYANAGIAEATILAGEAARIDNMPVIVSEFIRENLNANGRYDGTTTNRTTAIVVNRNEFVVGQVGSPTLDTDRDVTTGSNQLVGTHRVDFKDYRDSTQKNVASVVNLSAS